MGSKDALAYLASPAVVAASAVSGYIDFDLIDEKKSIIAEIKKVNKKSKTTSSVRIVEGFPEVIEGDLVFCHQDNLNTDGIYPGKYTYIDDFKPEDQAKVVMENYDADFSKKVKEGDILVGGYNFGTGSSREQAATALKHRGIQAVIVGSASQTYMRNALNNGFLVIESPDLVDYLKNKYGKEKLTVHTQEKSKINFKESILLFDNNEFSISPVGGAAQELIVVGGLENWIIKNLEK